MYKIFKGQRSDAGDTVSVHVTIKRLGDVITSNLPSGEWKKRFKREKRIKVRFDKRSASTEELYVAI